MFIFIPVSLRGLLVTFGHEHHSCVNPETVTITNVQHVNRSLRGEAVISLTWWASLHYCSNVLTMAALLSRVLVLWKLINDADS